MSRDDSVVFEIAPKYCISDSFVEYEGYSISSRIFFPTVVGIWSSGLNFPIAVHFSSLIPKMVVFIVAISCLTTCTSIYGPNIPGSYAILFFTASDFTFTTRHVHSWALFLLWLTLFITSGAVSLLFSSSMLGTCRPGRVIFQCHTFCLFILFLGFSRQEYWSGFPFPSPVDHVLSELSTMTHPCWWPYMAWLMVSLS